VCSSDLWTNKNIHPSKVVNVGDEVEVMVLDIDEERRRISLGIKQCKTNPWEDFSGQFNKGDKISGTIKSITDFGIFIGLDGGIDGLVHLSDISWNEAGEEAVRRFKKGDELETVILSVDRERERISLGIKQLDSDPFTNFTTLNDRGATVTGVVKTVGEKVSHLRAGDRVMALTGWGGFAEEVAVPTYNVLPVPKSMDLTTAAAFGMTYGTSMHALKQRANLQPGETLLVLGASGGVGLAAVEIGKAGAELYDRIAVAAEHLKRVGGGLESAVNNSNKFVSSFERNVVSSGKRLRDKGIEIGKREIEEVPLIEAAPRYSGSEAPALTEDAD
jgi:predicted RNA-binding protein with RPS1 domain